MSSPDNTAGDLRLLMTLDAVGGVWRYAIDLAGELKSLGIETVFVGLGPRPATHQVQEAEEIGELIWLDAPLEWMVEDEAALSSLPALLQDLAAKHGADLLHLNAPSQAVGIDPALPVLAVSHSCVATWFAGVRGERLPAGWEWQHAINRKGFDRADVVVTPSRSHASMIKQVYGEIADLHVVANATRLTVQKQPKNRLAFAAGRWWDEGKNGAVLDAAAPHMRLPLVMAGANRGPNGQFLPIVHAVHRGELNHAETAALMARAEVVLSPSLYEPFGLSVLEAARSRSALVLADIPTYRELWHEAALFVDPHDAEAFADAANRFADDDALRAKLSAEALRRALDFTPQIQAKAMAELYQSLLQRAATPSDTMTAAE
ncbi:glycosyltransferase family 4 protein [Allorhizobium taibaishanense]|uniref:Glycosyl transferase n=1 Tax=Allorhizobium taibaishanense TaxID=887144 RepID=A0A1Q9A6L8_9HYPH|nr:glycosyltransferase family 4 protein [Allorhizobium taibaishanense]MBB4008639.1 glycosyltransferase involved in cell wall biosynthesis [Allorhizobium taibaishanense]OLP50226.1 glycosyl transferase [Allorhizobium taibaishanense]